MRCPHCNYQHGWDWNEDDQYVETDDGKGSFWESPIAMKRNVGSDYYDDGDREADVYGCPNCHKLFLNP